MKTTPLHMHVYILSVLQNFVAYQHRSCRISTSNFKRRVDQICRLHSAMESIITAKA